MLLFHGDVNDDRIHSPKHLVLTCAEDVPDAGGIVIDKMTTLCVSELCHGCLEGDNPGRKTVREETGRRVGSCGEGGAFKKGFL